MIADPSNRFVYVPCKGDDLIGELTFDQSSGMLGAIDNVATGDGSGPRHLAFHPAGGWAYGIAENSSTLTAYTLDTTSGRLSAIGPALSTLPADFDGQNTGAEVQVHPGGRWVLASNRGHDSLAVFAIDPQSGAITARGHGSTQGQTPRSFAIDPGGRWVLVANQDSGNVVVLDFDETAGTLTPTGTVIDVPLPSFVGVITLPQ
jgi:6-phosphogluconolactonase